MFQVYPLLGKDVFLQALRDLDLEIIQTDFEADQVGQIFNFIISILLMIVLESHE